MAITHFLMQSNINSTHLHPTKWSNNNINIAFKRNYSSCSIKTFPKFNIKCFMMNPKSEEDDNFKNVGTETGMKALQISIISGALLLLCGHQQALAASGGRMGGRGRSRSSSRSSSRSRSHSSRLSRPSSDSSSESYTTAIGTPDPINPTQAKPPISRMVFCFFGGFVCFLIKEWCDGKLSSSYDNIKGHTKTTLLKLQVGSLGTGRLLQKDLNRIAESADTSTTNCLHSVLQETISALLRHSEYCISGYSSLDVKTSVAECEKQFDQVSIEERGKFDEETLVNVNNIKMKSTTSQSSNGLPNEYIVVTIIVAARGELELPPIKSSEELKNALQKLASIPSSDVVGAEVLWTPQKEDDSLTEQEMLEDYPLLHTF